MKSFISDVILTVLLLLVVSLFVAMSVLNGLCQMESFEGTTRQILVIGLTVTSATFYALMRFTVPKIRASWRKQFGDALKPARKREKFSLKRVLERHRRHKEFDRWYAQYKERKNRPAGEDYDIPLGQT